MAEQRTRQTLLLSMDLGSLAQYEQSIFPLSRVQGKGTTVDQVDLYLQATLNEIFKIRIITRDSENFQDLIYNAKTQYDELNTMLKTRKMEQQRKSLNPIKMFSAYRSVRLLLEAGRALYTETKTASEKLRRQLLSQTVDAEDVQPVEYNDLPSNARIGGVAISLDSEFQPDETMASYFTEAASFIASQVDLLGEGNPFADEHQVEDSQASAEHGSSSTTGPAAATSDGGTATPTNSRLSGASGNNYFFFQNSYVASNSAIQTPTLNSGGSRNQGATTR
ncbi:hypothetical protein BDR07DRAFT_1479490 [Suillus spraguei]|nr:hypothetical protein BDR07DRAFT_1479490 [Suillus spraguei]